MGLGGWQARPRVSCPSAEQVVALNHAQPLPAGCRPWNGLHGGKEKERRKESHVIFLSGWLKTSLPIFMMNIFETEGNA